MMINPYSNPVWGGLSLSAPAMQVMQPSRTQSLQAISPLNSGQNLANAFPSAAPGNNVLDSIINILSMVMMLIQSLFSQLQGGGQNGLNTAQQSPFDGQGSNSDTQSGCGNSSGSGSGGQNSVSPAANMTPPVSGNQAKSASLTTGGVPTYGSPDWGAPASDTTDPNGAYQVPGGFEPPKGDEKATGDPNVDANPGVVQNADSAPDDTQSHSRVDGNTQKHSIQQIDQMYGASIQKALDKYNAQYGTHCPKQVIEGIIYQETQGDPNTLGKDDPAQSRGLMQVTAENAAQDAPGKNQYNPDVSIDTGVGAFLRVVAQKNSNYSRALAAYNQGIDTTSQGKAYAQWVQLWASQAPN